MATAPHSEGGATETWDEEMKMSGESRWVQSRNDTMINDVRRSDGTVLVKAT